MQLTSQQIMRMMHGDAKINDVGMCAHLTAAEHHCAPVPGMSDTFVMRVAGHFLSDDPDAHPDKVPGDADLVYVDVYLSSDHVTQMVSELTAAVVGSMACHAAGDSIMDGTSSIHLNGMLGLAQRVFRYRDPEDADTWRPYDIRKDGNAS